MESNATTMVINNQIYSATCNKRHVAYLHVQNRSVLLVGWLLSSQTSE